MNLFARIPTKRMGAIALLWITSTSFASAATTVHAFTDQHVGVLYTSSGDQSITVPFKFSQTLPQFNPALGTLDYITIEMSFIFRVSGDTGNESFGGNLSASLGGTLYMGDVSYSGVGEGVGSGDGPGNLLLAEFTVAKNDTLNAVAGANPAGYLANPAIFTNSTGTGTVEWDYRSTEDFMLTFSTTGNASGQLEITTDSLVITYGFTPVPEPSSTALLGLGGLALILCRRRQ